MDAEAVEYARAHHSADNTRFVDGSVTDLPFPDGSFDAVVSFETLEHIDEQSQERFIAESKRVLLPNGVLCISTPEADMTRQREIVNPFHVHERTRESLERLLRAHYRNVSLYYQNLWIYNEIAPVDRIVEVSVDPPTTGQNLIAVCSDGPLPDVSTHWRTSHDYVEVAMVGNRQVSAMMRTVSWRITSPLRRLRSLFR